MERMGYKVKSYANITKSKANEALFEETKENKNKDERLMGRRCPALG